MTQEFKTYRHFSIDKASYSPHKDFDWEAVHKDYDGEGDNRLFRAPSEDYLLVDIDNWYENEENFAFRQLMGLFDLILSRWDVSQEVKKAITDSWRYKFAADCLDSSRGTQKMDAEAPIE